VSVPESVALPTQGRAERAHLYEWICGEEEYVAGKFDDQRDGHDQTFRDYDIDAFWVRQIVQYFDRARVFLDAAKASGSSNRSQRHLEMRAQQAIVKAMMTCKGMAESSIRVYGPLPTPGVSSGEIREWGAHAAE
jgi:hypothetical protein